MPRRAKASQAVECVAHGWRCALAGGGKYRSDRCEPAVDLPQLVELLAMVDQAQGVTEAERGRRARLTPAQMDAEYRAALARTEEWNAVKLAGILAGEVVSA